MRRKNQSPGFCSGQAIRLNLPAFRVWLQPSHLKEKLIAFFLWLAIFGNHADRQGRIVLEV